MDVSITNAVPKDELRKIVYKSDVVTLLQDGLEKVVQGETSFEEILKVVDLDNDLSSYEDSSLQSSLDDIENHDKANKKEEVKKEEVKKEDNDNKPLVQEDDVDYASLIPTDPENHKSEIPHDNAKPGEIEYFNF